MNNKSKKFTLRHSAVKILSFVLILALAFNIMHRLNSCYIRFDETGISPELVLYDLSTNQFFADMNTGDAVRHAAQLVYYGNEEAIIRGDFIKWTDWIETYYNYQEGYEYEKRLGSLLTTPDNSYYFSQLEQDYDTPEGREYEEQRFIRMQLDSFRRSKEYFLSTEGLVYYLEDTSGNIISNVGADVDWFRAQPVYYINDSITYDETARSHSYSYNWRYTSAPHWMPGEGRLIYLAFTPEAISAKNSIYHDVQMEYVYDIIAIAISAVLCIALLVILLLGAGRRRPSFESTAQNDVSNGVFFSPIDKPFLDIGLVIVICWSALMVGIALLIAPPIWTHQNISAMTVLLIAASITIVSPCLLWLMSLAKRIKAGRFWRHTLVYFIPSKFGRFLKSLWAGFPLTAKVGLISLASFLIMLFIGLVCYAAYNYGAFFPILLSLLFTALVTVLLLRYARRIHILEEAARKTSGGDYNAAINVGGGELGSIAHSINNISAGINTAVEQRMKSERLKTELITNVSHDIRTPLTSIITYTDLLKHEGLDCEKAGEYLDVLVQKSQRLKTLTDELFEAAKAATGNIEVNITELDIVSLIGQVLGELDGAIKSSGLDMRVSLPEKLMVLADGKLMWRVMENLLSNVFKYSLSGSRVYLETRLENAFAIVELKNISATELNIDPNELTERFKRGDISRTDGGSGLGLSIVQSFVSAQDGRFTISIDGDLFKARVYLRNCP